MTETTLQIQEGTAVDLGAIHDHSVDLVVTSPPYPMIAMWDEVFFSQCPEARSAMQRAEGTVAFEEMHKVLDRAWREVSRVLKPGGIACINIGDATRTLGGDFQLYSNHSRVLTRLIGLGLTPLPDILWRKQTNAPNKFMGSGMLPVGAYVTYEHEYILILRNGPRRMFKDASDRKRRRESAFFWEERNVWFSDVWLDIKGSLQRSKNGASRERSAAFPFELPYRLICMFSIQGDVVLDPFAGTGTSLLAALATGRNAIGVEIDPSFIPQLSADLLGAVDAINTYNENRLARHIGFVQERFAENKPLKYRSNWYGFPVMTSQETDLIINKVLNVEPGHPHCFSVQYAKEAQPAFVQEWTRDQVLDFVNRSALKSQDNKRKHGGSHARSQEELTLPFSQP